MRALGEAKDKTGFGVRDTAKGATNVVIVGPRGRKIVCMKRVWRLTGGFGFGFRGGVHVEMCDIDRLEAPEVEWLEVLQSRHARNNLVVV